MDIKKLMSERAQTSDDFNRLVIDPAQNELDKIYRLTSVFTNIQSLDYVSDKFIAKLADYIGFDYIDTEDTEVQREIMKRIISEYHKKGSYEQIYKACARAYDDNWVSGDLTYYRGSIKDGYVHISYPRDYMFRYDYSRWDEGTKWADEDKVMHGVIDLWMSEYSENTSKALDKIIPGGIKYLITLMKDLPGSGSDIIDYKYKTLDSLFDEWVQIDLPKPYWFYTDSNELIYDENKLDNTIWQGRNVSTVDVWDEKVPQGSGVYDIIQPSDETYVAAIVADQKFIINEQRQYGELKKELWVN